MFVYFVFLIFPHVILTNVINECPPCNCSIKRGFPNKDNLTNADCSALIRLSGLTDIPETIQSNINTLNFYGQAFTMLKNNSFTRFNNLINIFFPRNKIEVLEPNTFNNLTNLTIISLAQNNITSLPDGIFNDLHQLILIYINNNNIKVLQQHLFSNLPNFKYLYIDLNGITTIEEDSFFNLPSLLRVCLSHNKLTTLNYNIIDDINKLEYFDFYSNPWNCTEKLCPILGSAKFESVELSYCSSPPNLFGKSWLDLLGIFPPSISNTQNVFEGETTSIICRYCFATKVIWQLPVPSRNHTVEVSTVSLTSSLILENVTQRDTGYYRCQVDGCSTCKVGTFLNVQKGNESDSVSSIPIFIQSRNETSKVNKNTKSSSSRSFLITVLIIPTILLITIGIYICYYKRIRQIFCPKKKQLTETEQELSFLRGEAS